MVENLSGKPCCICDGCCDDAGCCHGYCQKHSHLGTKFSIGETPKIILASDEVVKLMQQRVSAGIPIGSWIVALLINRLQAAEDALHIYTDIYDSDEPNVAREHFERVSKVE